MVSDNLNSGHFGYTLMEWDQELFEYRLSKAYDTLKDATILANSKRWNSCVNCLYYACFYAVLALLMKDGKSSSKHTGSYRGRL